MGGAAAGDVGITDVGGTACAVTLLNMVTVNEL